MCEPLICMFAVACENLRGVLQSVRQCHDTRWVVSTLLTSPLIYPDTQLVVGKIQRFQRAVERSKKEAAAAREKAAALEQAAKKVRSKFKIGQAVTWTSSDNDVPEGTVGVVTSQCDDGVSANVKFRDGARKFKYTQLRISSKKPTVSFFCSFFFWLTFFFV